MTQRELELRSEDWRLGFCYGGDCWDGGVGWEWHGGWTNDGRADAVKMQLGSITVRLRRCNCLSAC